MNNRRKIKAEELRLLEYLLERANLSIANYFNEDMLVDDYEGAVMRSIGIGDAEQATYQGDVIQGFYTDTDGVPVVITLTKCTEDKLLDLDFWKEDFSKLIRYPEPADLEFE